MSENVALYRKYRPQSFKDVRDQDHIVTVLKGAIEKKTIPHAILFSGTRGTGKTTLARIFAKAIGCSDVDIYEMDAASNRGIDDVRELREAVYTLPYESTHKVYIIDEVHMLTKEAFNAILKTLEEPPLHVIFILATTEEEKLLDTILSRCQVFRMRTPSREVLQKTVLDVAHKEGFTLTRDAADLVAIAADGSFRDALGITQKVILASADGEAGSDEVADIIGAPKQTHLLKLLIALSTKNKEDALGVLFEVDKAHVEARLFMRLLLERVRSVILLRNAPSVGEKALGRMREEEIQEIRTLALDKNSALNSHALLALLRAADSVGKTAIPLLPLELAVLEICN